MREREHLEIPGIDGKIILRWIFRKGNVGGWTGPIWAASTCESGNEPSSSIKCGEFLDQLRSN
jgi:hypothetical protein